MEIIWNSPSHKNFAKKYDPSNPFRTMIFKLLQGKNDAPDIGNVISVDDFNSKE
jgi:hypothetical protein